MNKLIKIILFTNNMYFYIFYRKTMLQVLIEQKKKCDNIFSDGGFVTRMSHLMNKLIKIILFKLNKRKNVIISLVMVDLLRECLT